jgi:IMP dehydrogenase
MDRITECQLAIELAKLGGIGIIHKNMNPTQQALQVSRVKRNLSGRIDNPRCVFEDETIESIYRFKQNEDLDFSSFPVKNRPGKLVGVITSRDLLFCKDRTKLVRDVMTPYDKLITADPDTTIEQAYERMADNRVKTLPLVTGENEFVGLYVFVDAQRIAEGDADNYNVDEKNRLRVGAAIGVREDAFSRLEQLTKKEVGVDVVVIDTAHGHTKDTIETLREVKRFYQDLDVVAGNISESDSVKPLLDAGANGIKVGQGPGSICTTRVIAGVGAPQITAIYNCAKAAWESEVPVCGDGGIEYSGDITKAIAAGAHCVMLGNVLAGVDETPGEILTFSGEQFKEYRGMGSLGAMTVHQGSRDRYGQTDSRKLVPEGVESRVSYKGPLAELIFQLVGGLRSGMGYTGSNNIGELRKNGRFKIISPAGSRESHPHGVTITREPPNYRIAEK